MLVIHHRRNTINSLKAVNSHLGVEVDIRSFGNKLIINHDPFKESINFISSKQSKKNYRYYR